MAENTKGGARLQKSPSSGHKKLKIALGVLLTLVIATCGSFCALAATCDTVFPGTTVLGNPVGGMTEAKAEETLRSLLPEAYRSHGISVRMDGEEVLLASLTDLGLSPEPAECAKLAYEAGRSGNILLDGYAYARCLLMGQEVAPPLDLAERSLKEAAGTILATLDREAQPVQYRLDEADTAHVFFTQACEGVKVNGEKLLADLTAMVNSGTLGSIDCEYETLPYDESITVKSLAEKLLNERKNAWYDPETEEITEAVIGVDFDVAKAEELLAAAAPGEEIAVPGEVAFPAVYKDELKDVLFRDVLATYTTKVSGTANRVTNVRLSAAACNNTIMNSGDEFSYNKRVGKRTEERGYRGADAYFAGETVETIGGGICQTSSTLYAACLHANLEITQRTAHRYVSSYMPYGLDATVSWGTLDYRFRNNTDYPIKIVTHYENRQLTVTIYGTKVNDNYVVMTHEQIGGSIGWETVYQETPDLPVGTEEVKQTPYTGRKIQTYRNIYAADGTLISTEKEAFSDYKSRNKIILVGTAGAVTPPDEGTGGAVNDEIFDWGESEDDDLETGTPSSKPGGGTATGDEEIFDWGEDE